MAQPFIHLRVHTAYSLSEGAVRIKELAKRCVGESIPAVAICDSNNLFGALEFSEAMLGAGVQPIIGCVLNFQPVREQSNRPSKPPAPEKLVLLVQNEAGYQNLMALVSESFLSPVEEPAPLLSYDALDGRTDGLICLTAGTPGGFMRHLLSGRHEDAEAFLSRLKGWFGDRLYIELQRHELEAEKQAEPLAVTLAAKHAVPLVATNHVFFPDEAMYESHDALLCIADGTYVVEEDRRRLNPHFRLKSQEEMRALFADLPEAIANTAVIARRCAYASPKRHPILPNFVDDPNSNEAEEFTKVAKDGLQWRLDTYVFPKNASEEEKTEIAKPYWERLEFEIKTIIHMQFPGYFLIVSDFIRWAKEHEIPVGPGRGSGAGSLVAWAMKITDLDPLRYQLLFERFLNPERVSMPDFDVDFCQERRDEVISYTQKKYGYDKVAQIITFGKLQARAVVRDVGRVLQMPYPQVDKICKLIPNNPANPVTLQEAIDMEPMLRQVIREDHEVARLVEIALHLEGLYRHSSTHAAGVVIGDRPLQELIPMYRDPKSDMPVVQFSMKYAEMAGLVKFDFLGLKTLTVLSTACQKIKKTNNIEIDLLKLPEGDKPTYELLGEGQSVGVFQLESAGMRDTLRKLKPDSMEDIIALVSLYRPGPMDNIPTYIARKHGLEKPEYPHESIQSILEETFGVIIYQEQVMQIAQVMGGYSLGQADILRRAMGKKIKEEMDKQRGIFVEGATAKGVSKAKAEEVFELMAKFASYGFNKSHAAAYALIAYQTAYLKANYPAEFFVGLMCLDAGNTDKLLIYCQDAARTGIEVLPPDVNRSSANFDVEWLETAAEDEQEASAGSNSSRGQETEPSPEPASLREQEASAGSNPKKPLAIRYALGALKNVGMTAMEALVAEREANGPFEDIFDFAGRMDGRVMNRRQMEYLIKAGAFDSLYPNRRQLFDGLDVLLQYSQAVQQEKESNQSSLFGDASTGGGVPQPRLPECREWSLNERLNHEFTAVGFYLSAHPLDAYGELIGSFGVVSSHELNERLSGEYKPVNVAGMVMGRKVKVSDKGRFAFITLSDASGSYEASVFDEELLTKNWELLDSGQMVLLRCEGKRDDSGARLIIQGVDALEEAIARSPEARKGRAEIVVDASFDPAQLQGQLPQGRRNVDSNIFLLVPVTEGANKGKAVRIALPGHYPVTPQLKERFEEVAGIVEILPDG